MGSNILYRAVGLLFVFLLTTAATRYVAKTGADSGNCSVSAQSNNLTIDPLFMNVSANDFRLRLGSSAINTGVDLSSIFTTDITGATRQIPFDIGAYEFLGVLFIGNKLFNLSSSSMFNVGN